jgi:hypothetical protein
MDNFIQEVRRIQARYGRTVTIVLLLASVSVVVAACSTGSPMRIEGRLPFNGDLVITQ